jgi:hypothetical protein
MTFQGNPPETTSPPESASAPIFAQLRGQIAAVPTSFHVALDTFDARRLRDDPEQVSIPGFLLFDTGEYATVCALVPLQIFWRMQGMDILAHTRAANRHRRADTQGPAMSGSVWLVDATLEGGAPGASNAATGDPGPGPSGEAPANLRVSALHALDRVAIEPLGPRHIESIDTRAMLPRFAEGA